MVKNESVDKPKKRHRDQSSDEKVLKPDKFDDNNEAFVENYDNMGKIPSFTGFMQIYNTIKYSRKKLKSIENQISTNEKMMNKPRLHSLMNVIDNDIIGKIDIDQYRIKRKKRDRTKLTV